MQRYLRRICGQQARCHLVSWGYGQKSPSRDNQCFRLGIWLQSFKIGEKHSKWIGTFPQFNDRWYLLARGYWFCSFFQSKNIKSDRPACYAEKAISPASFLNNAATQTATSTDIYHSGQKTCRMLWYCSSVFDCCCLYYCFFIIVCRQPNTDTKSKGRASSTSWDHSFALYCFPARL